MRSSTLRGMIFDLMRGPMLGLILGLTGCAYVPATSLLRLSALDMLTVDPGEIRVAVGLPDVLNVREAGAVMYTGVRESASGPAVSESFILEEEKAALGTAALDAPQRWEGATEGSRVTVFRIAEQDLARLRALQTRIRERKSKYPDDVDGFLTVAAKACRTTDLPEGPLPITTWLRTRNNKAFFVLTRATDLRGVITKEALLDEVPPCP